MLDANERIVLEILKDIEADCNKTEGRYKRKPMISVNIFTEQFPDKELFFKCLSSLKYKGYVLLTNNDKCQPMPTFFKLTKKCYYP